VAEQALKAGDLPANTLIFDASDDEATDAEIEENELLNNLLADLGEMDNVKVHVSRCGKGNATTWVDSFTPSEMDIEQLMIGLRDNYGGGKFKITVREKGMIRKSKIIDIEPLPKKPEIDQAQIVRELQAEQQKESGGMAEIFARMMEANQQAQQHNADQQRQFMETMVTALAGRNDNQSQGPSMQETIMAVAELHKLSAPAKAIDPTEMILKGVELVGAIRGGDGDGEANIYSVLSKALGSFGGTLSQAMASAGTPMPGQFTAPAPGQPQAQLAAPETEQAPGLQPGKPTLAPDHALAPFEPYIDYMITLANKNANPELYAEVIVDQLGPELAYAWLATQDGLDTLARELPKVQPHMNWFMVVGRAVDELTREDDTTDDKSHQDGDVPTGHDSPATATNDAPIDGTTERIGRDQIDAAVDVEVGDASKNDSPDS